MRIPRQKNYCLVVYLQDLRDTDCSLIPKPTVM